MEMGLDKIGVSGVSENKIKAAESFSGGEFTRETLEDPHLVILSLNCSTNSALIKCLIKMYA